MFGSFMEPFNYTVWTIHDNTIWKPAARWLLIIYCNLPVR